MPVVINKPKGFVIQKTTVSAVLATAPPDEDELVTGADKEIPESDDVPFDPETGEVIEAPKGRRDRATSNARRKQELEVELREINAEIDEVRAKHSTRLEILGKELQGLDEAIVADLTVGVAEDKKVEELLGGDMVVKIGALKKKREVFDMELAAELFNKASPGAFMKSVTLSLAACDNYLTPAEREKIILEGWQGKRSVEVTPRSTPLKDKL